MRCKTLSTALRVALIYAGLFATAHNALSQTTSKARIEASTLDQTAMSVTFLSESPWVGCSRVRADISDPISYGWGQTIQGIPLNAARFCSFPDLKPCPDKDGDGVPACVSAAPDAPVSHAWQEKYVMQNGEWLAGSVKKPPIVAIMDSCATGTTSAGALSIGYTPWRDMSVPFAACPLVRFFTDNLKRTYPDCDDNNSKITLAQRGVGAIPSFSITRVDFTAANKEDAKARDVSVARRPFTLMDQIAVTVTPKRPSECQHQEQRVSIVLVLNRKRFLLAEVRLGDKAATYEIDLRKLAYDYSENEYSSDVIEDAIELIRKGGIPYLRVENEEFPKEVFAEIPFPLSNCLAIQGQGDKSIAFLSTQSLVSSIEQQGGTTGPAHSRNLLAQAATTLMSDLLSIAPFNQHKEKFSVWMDLALHDDRDWQKDFLATVNSSNGLHFFTRNFPQPLQVTSCRHVETIFAFANSFFSKEAKAVAVAFPMSSTVWVSPEVIRKQMGASESFASWATVHAGTYLHEYGHLVGGLADEYGKDSTWPAFEGDLPAEELLGDLIQKQTSRNCVLDPQTQFRSSLNGKLYGASTYNECGHKGLFRPSSHSHMNDLQGGFNVISCSFIQQGILRTPSNQPHLAECAAMPGINIEGVQK